jgi:hypothetical protein
MQYSIQISDSNVLLVREWRQEGLVLATVSSKYFNTDIRTWIWNRFKPINSRITERIHIYNVISLE